MPRKPSRPRTVSCAICGTSFETQHSMGKYCGDECSRKGARKSWRTYGHRNHEKRLAYRQEYYDVNSDAVIARTRQYKKTDAGRAAAKVSDARQRKKFPEKYAARQSVLKALRSGRLVRKPCEVCGAPKTQAHHTDYSKPLDVQWLCPDHHREADKELRLMTAK